MIEDYIEHNNTHPSRFVWTAKAEDILEKVGRARPAWIRCNLSETLH